MVYKTQFGVSLILTSGSGINIVMVIFWCGWLAMTVQYVCMLVCENLMGMENAHVTHIIMLRKVELVEYHENVDVSG